MRPLVCVNFPQTCVGSTPATSTWELICCKKRSPVRTTKKTPHFEPPATSQATVIADQAMARDLASVITLANELRAALAENGLIKGGL